MRRWGLFVSMVDMFGIRCNNEYKIWEMEKQEMNEVWAEAVISHLLETDADYVNDYLASELGYLKSRNYDECVGGVGYDTSDRVGFVSNPHNLVYSPTRAIMSVEDAIRIVEDAIRIRAL